MTMDDLDTLPMSAVDKKLWTLDLSPGGTYGRVHAHASAAYAYRRGACSWEAL